MTVSGSGLTVLAYAPKVKLVRRRNDVGGTDLHGCVLPRGRVRLVALRPAAHGDPVG